MRIINTMEKCVCVCVCVCKMLPYSLFIPVCTQICNTTETYFKADRSLFNNTNLQKETHFITSFCLSNTPQSIVYMSSLFIIKKRLLLSTRVDHYYSTHAYALNTPAYTCTRTHMHARTHASKDSHTHTLRCKTKA